MINTLLLQGFAYPWKLINHQGFVLVAGHGTLFREPDYSRPEATMRFLREIREPGWSQCPSGMLTFSHRISRDDHTLLVFPGLSESRLIRLRSAGDRAPPTISSRQDFERLVLEGLEINRKATEMLSIQSLSYIHDYRRINATLYALALRLLRVLTEKPEDVQMMKQLSADIVSLSQLHKTTTDWAEFCAEPTAMISKISGVPIGNRVERIANCWRLIAEKKHVSISVDNKSRLVIPGPPVFDLIPYSLLDNAVKYSPTHEKIDVSIQDQVDGVAISISSIGPMIEESERKRIFEIKERGKHALLSGIVGSGIGLSIIGDILSNFFAGRIEVSASERSVIRGVPHGNITFQIVMES